VTSPTTRWAGIENLKIMGGTNTSYLGAMAAGIDISNAAYCWVKDVQTGGTIGGVHISLTGTYRCVVRDSYVHHSADYGFGKDCYGIVLKCGAAENLIENNIARYMNKPISSTRLEAETLSPTITRIMRGPRPGHGKNILSTPIARFHTWN
jgi:hypothetical protein